ncbi:MAG: hypothetical protein HYV27_18560 [Candidatus Hydrogenedentes bacterium]|nr:hypothetical protein [Candidatus Hydrogenedentota bacterium]
MTRSFLAAILALALTGHALAEDANTPPKRTTAPARIAAPSTPAVKVKTRMVHKDRTWDGIRMQSAELSGAIAVKKQHVKGKEQTQTFFIVTEAKNLKGEPIPALAGVELKVDGPQEAAAKLDGKTVQAKGDIFNGKTAILSEIKEAAPEKAVDAPAPPAAPKKKTKPATP